LINQSTHDTNNAVVPKFTSSTDEASLQPKFKQTINFSKSTAAPIPILKKTHSQYSIQSNATDNDNEDLLTIMSSESKLITGSTRQQTIRVISKY